MALCSYHLSSNHLSLVTSNPGPWGPLSMTSVYQETPWHYVAVVFLEPFFLTSSGRNLQVSHELLNECT